MARYQPVRPKPQPQHHSVPTPAAPAQPAPKGKLTEAQLHALETRMKEAAEKMYLENGGEELDASIARCKHLLAIHDRELEVVAKSDFSQPHRWTVSPAIAFRFDKLQHELLAKRDYLLAECLSLVKRTMREAVGPDEPLCPTECATPAAQPTSETASQPPKPKEPAEAATIGV